MSTITQLNYSNTNTYLIQGERGRILFDTGWAGSFDAFCRECGKTGVTVQSIDYILISHFHPDHMGIAQNIADCGATIVVIDIQAACIHASDGIFEKENRKDFIPVADDKVRIITIEESRAFLKESGIDGQILHTPGHSDDSISLCLDDGVLFVGDLNPLYEIELHKGTQIEESWNMLLKLKPLRIYYGHAKPAEPVKYNSQEDKYDDMYHLVRQIMRYTDKGTSVEKIAQKTGADPGFITKVIRMYLTHQGIGVQGILDRIM